LSVRNIVDNRVHAPPGGLVKMAGEKLASRADGGRTKPVDVPGPLSHARTLAYPVAIAVP